LNQQHQHNNLLTLKITHNNIAALDERQHRKMTHSDKNYSMIGG